MARRSANSDKRCQKTKKQKKNQEKLKLVAISPTVTKSYEKSKFPM